MKVLAQATIFYILTLTIMCCVLWQDNSEIDKLRKQVQAEKGRASVCIEHIQDLKKQAKIYKDDYELCEAGYERIRQ